MDWWTELLQQRAGSTAMGYDPLGVPQVDVGAAQTAQTVGGGSALNASEGSGLSMGAVVGIMQGVSGLAGSFEAIKNQRSALKIQQIQNRINKRFATANFERKMTGLFQSHRDLEEQSAQQHMQREVAYQQEAGRMKVMQAEVGMAGKSAKEAKGALTRSNFVAEQIQIANTKKAQRALAYEREGISDQRLAEELGFNMADANIAAQLRVPAWAQVGADSPGHVVDGLNTYYNFVRYSGTNQDVV